MDDIAIRLSHRESAVVNDGFGLRVAERLSASPDGLIRHEDLVGRAPRFVKAVCQPLAHLFEIAVDPLFEGHGVSWLRAHFDHPLKFSGAL